MIKAYISFALVAKSYKVSNSSDATQVKKMCRLTNTTNMIVKSEILVKQTSRSLTLEKHDTCVL